MKKIQFRFKYRTGVMLVILIIFLIFGIVALAIYDHVTTIYTTETDGPTVTRTVNPTVTTTTTQQCMVTNVNGNLDLYCLQSTTTGT